MQRILKRTLPSPKTAPSQTAPTAKAEDNSNSSTEEPADRLDDNLSMVGSEYLDDGMKDFQSTLDMICNSSMDPVIIIEELGKIKSVNQEAMDLFGYKMWELVGSDIKKVMTEKYARHHHYYLERYMRTKMKRIIGQRRTGLEGVRKDGRVLLLDSKVQAIQGLNGGSVFIGLLRDMGIDSELGKVKTMIGNVLPKGYEERVMNGQHIADQYYACVMSLTIENLTSYAKKTPPGEVITMLSKLFNEFDTACNKFKVTRIKTMGSCYLAAAGVTKIRYDAALRVMEAALAIKEAMSKMPEFTVRIGVSTGHVLSGVCRGQQLTFDVWGEPVDVATKLQLKAPSSTILVCEKTYKQTKILVDYKQLSTTKEKAERVFCAIKRKNTL